ncbi:hypothetical protein BN85301590 [Paracholeplasma brassicae]|uniref:Uncharacterized protein n=1 Tax=Acholeplasma brassicae TaxID=61635 RepID=U4KMB8_9MOLU|nr:hypothetical protein [Paracholeplasma brassicae]CCV65176.1 hypothetical protein BN85301550 [Paracholeplasma brassicae]CCV65178.1 hypothetical protein BN85301570 [Paracholeplasma brassicae]CCV65180.1 hypothetical protein BN85301590 [Paracholeplasma brassicae]
MKKIIISLFVIVASLGAIVGHLSQKEAKVYEAEVTMHRGYIEDVGLPDGPGR